MSTKQVRLFPWALPVNNGIGTITQNKMTVTSLYTTSTITTVTNFNDRVEFEDQNGGKVDSVYDRHLSTLLKIGTLPPLPLIFIYFFKNFFPIYYFILYLFILLLSILYLYLLFVTFLLFLFFFIYLIIIFFIYLLFFIF